MNIRTLFIFITLAVLIVSCKNTAKTTKSDSPYLTEEVNSKTEITVREEKVKPVDQPNEPVYRFYVIIGSFRNVDNARQHKTDLVKEGYTTVILENEKGLFRVSAGAYNEERAARNKIAEIRAASDKHDDVWLLVRK